MDATRTRRTRDRARQAWYAWHRQWRFARFLGFLNSTGPATERRPSPGPAFSTRRREASFEIKYFYILILYNFLSIRSPLTATTGAAPLRIG
jgi:hypothetical protein